MLITADNQIVVQSNPTAIYYMQYNIRALQSRTANNNHRSNLSIKLIIDWLPDFDLEQIVAGVFDGTETDETNKNKTNQIKFNDNSRGRRKRRLRKKDPSGS